MLNNEEVTESLLLKNISSNKLKKTLVGFEKQTVLMLFSFEFLIKLFYYYS